jgi:N-acetylglucosaminyl-diphospho-decaprenol L-rhamnosyltransferase
VGSEAGTAVARAGAGGPWDIVGAMPTTLAVQIVNYRTRRYLERCVETVVADLAGSELSYEVNLLDNASGEDLHELAGRFSNCTAFSAPENLGFGGGHNLLADRTEAPYLLILNPDIEVVVPGSIERLIAIVAGGDRVKAVGPKLLLPDGAVQPYDHGRLHGLRATIALNGGHSYWRATDVRQEVAWVSGAAMAVERAAFTAVGGFDEQLFLYKEDEDLCLRLRRRGARVMYDAGVTVRHQGSVVASREDAMASATGYYFAKHFPNRRSQRAYARVHQWLAYMRM